MADIKIKYPATSSVALSIALGALASDSSLLTGKESAMVDNTTTLDLDHLVAGYICTGTSPTAGKTIEVWAYACYKTASNVPSFPDVLDGTGSSETLQNANIKAGVLKSVATFTVTSGSNLAYMIPPTSIAALFGALPKFWGLFVTHDTGVALLTGDGSHVLEYERIQMQTV